MTTGSSCSYFVEPYPQNSTYVTGVQFITIPQTSSLLVGNGNPSFTVAPNHGAPRKGAIMVGGDVFTLTQDAPNCYYTLSTTSATIPTRGGTGSIGVTASSPSCAWTAKSSNTSLLSVTSGASGTGNGTVNYSVPVNAGGPQTATLTIGDTSGYSIFTENQVSAFTCSFTITPPSIEVSSNGISNFFVVNASYSFCKWTATSSDPNSLTIGDVSGQTGLSTNGSATGTGVVYYRVAQNNSGTPRTLTITAGCQTFTVNQDGAPSNNPKPAIKTLQPMSVTAGTGGFTLTVNGSGFISSSVVNFNGKAKVTTYVSASQLTAPILSSDVATAGTPAVTVTNPAPGGGTSNAVTLTVTGGSSGQVATPVISPAGGTYDLFQSVTITDSNPGATIFYTTNGTPPTASSTKYTGPISVVATETIEALAVASGYSNSAVATAAYTITSPAMQFVNVMPCRIADTRNATGTFGGPELTAGETRVFEIQLSACNIPSTAVAYSLNVTVVPSGPLNYLTIWPTGETQPTVSTLNSDGRVKANAAIVPTGANGGVSVFVSDATQLVLDIDGYFVPAGTASALAFYPLTPCRIADTRNAAGPLGGPFISGGKSRAFPILSSNCKIPSTAQAYSLNVTAVPHTTLNYLTIWPTGETQPYVSTLNSWTGTVVANAALVPAGSGGDISVFVHDDADVVMDIDGYFAPPSTGGLALYRVTPCRVIDTRPTAFNGVKAVNVEGSKCAPPSNAQAYVLNATVVPPGFLNYLTLWPEGESQPYVSTLNSYDGAIASNMAIVPTLNGSIEAFAYNPTNLILDISSYFAP